MKKFSILFVLGALLLTGCGVDTKTVLSNPEKDYYATGAWADWGNTTAKMTAVSRGDEAVASIKDQLDHAEFLYIYKNIVLTDNQIWGSTYTIDGVETVLNGGQSVKAIRTAIDDKDTVDYWIQSPESGAVSNLTPETLFIPNFVETAVEGIPGTWNDNLFGYETGTYTMVYAYIAAVGDVAAHHAMGLIATPAAA